MPEAGTMKNEDPPFGKGGMGGFFTKQSRLLGKEFEHDRSDRG
jgi:hypothetical protein